MVKSVIPFLIERVRAFRADEEGAVTVDFVILTSSVILMGLAHVADVASGTTSIADNVDACLGSDLTTMLDNIDADNYIAQLEAAGAACSAR
ncbi:MAG: hypothetical protein AAGL89_15420 [Pseudomonadota bacterium]